MIELGMIRDLVTIFGVIAAFTYYALTVRNANKARKIQTWQINQSIVDEKMTLDWTTVFHCARAPKRYRRKASDDIQGSTG